MTTILFNREIYERVVCGIVPQANERLWIATADIKDMYVDTGGRDTVPFLEVLDGVLKRGVEVRLIHAKEPGPNWRNDFDRYPGLWRGMERMLCPRVHFKCIIVDGFKAYFGSANLTGAGMGAKQFDSVWRGAFCPDCGRRIFCGDCPLDDASLKQPYAGRRI